MSAIPATARPLPIAFQLGARTLFRIDRRLVRIGLALDDVLRGAPPVLPPLPGDADGYLLTSLPETQRPAVMAHGGGLIAFERQRYTRYYTDLTTGADAWWASLSANTRSGLKRKAKKLAPLDIRRFRTADEMAEFHAAARTVAATTYQERLLGAALPADDRFVRGMLADAAAGHARGWLLSIEGRPVAYLYTPIRDGVAIYAYVGHDPAVGALSPGAVLQVEAMRDLLDEGTLRHFDFTEGEGQHKRSLATGGVACVDLLLLRPTIANRATLAALGAFDAGVGAAKALVQRAGIEDRVRRLRRG